MAHTMLLNDVFHLKMFNSAHLSQSAINTVGYKVTSVVAPGVTDQDLVDFLSARVGPLYRAYMVSDGRYEGSSLQVLRPVLQPTVISTSGTGVGSKTGELLPLPTSMLFSLRTQQAGKSGRGRIYLPFWSEGDNSNLTRPDGPTLALGAAWVASMIANITVNVGAFALVISPVVISRANGLFNTYPITQTLQRGEWATQRRRALINKPDTLSPR